MDRLVNVHYLHKHCHIRDTPQVDRLIVKSNQHNIMSAVTLRNPVLSKTLPPCVIAKATLLKAAPTS